MAVAKKRVFPKEASREHRLISERTSEPRYLDDKCGGFRPLL